MSIEELQQKLEGVFDLNTVEDCRSVIISLLNNIQFSDKAKNDAEAKLKVLALLVSSDKPNAKEVAKKVLEKAEGKSPSEVMDFLFKMCDETTRAEKLDDSELVSDAIKAWAEFNMHSRDSAVIDELIRRFRTAKGMTNVLDKVPEVPKQ